MTGRRTHDTKRHARSTGKISRIVFSVQTRRNEVVHEVEQCLLPRSCKFKEGSSVGLICYPSLFQAALQTSTHMDHSRAVHFMF